MSQYFLFKKKILCGLFLIVLSHLNIPVYERDIICTSSWSNLAKKISPYEACFGILKLIKWTCLWALKIEDKREKEWSHQKLIFQSNVLVCSWREQYSLVSLSINLAVFLTSHLPEWKAAPILWWKIMKQQDNMYTYKLLSLTSGNSQESSHHSVKSQSDRATSLQFSVVSEPTWGQAQWDSQGLHAGKW